MAVQGADPEAVDAAEMGDFAGDRLQVKMEEAMTF